MIQISKDEARMLRQHFPGVAIKRTVNKYYIEERPRVLEFLKRVAAMKVVSSHC